jgi:putative Ca2+/H+ antiporter (TMEM165/GDT1 family)
VNLAVIITTFAIILPAELPDKSMIAALVLGTRFRPLYVYLGVITAFAVHVVIAVIAGSLLSKLPRQPLELIVALLFLIGAYLLLKHHGGEGDAEKLTSKPPDRPSFWKVVSLGFMVIFIPEFGDLTQIATANLAAKFHDPLSVGLGSLLALWTAGAIGVWGGRNLLRLIPIKWFTRLAATLLFILALGSFVTAARS